MKNTFGQSITVTIFGESHGDAIGCVIDGIAPGIRVERDYIAKRLDQRRPYGKCATARHEADEPRILSGIFNGYTTGTPIAVVIENGDTKSKDYSPLKDTPRPSHADYTAREKYHGFEDYRGGGHFSGRITAALVCAGAILSSALLAKGIRIGTHISRLHGIDDRGFLDTDADIAALDEKLFPVLSNDAERKMISEIEDAASRGDSVGGVLESVITGIPAGVGEPWFDSMESVISHLLFSVPAVKGVEFGEGFAIAELLGSEANDPFTYKDGRIVTATNKSGGINGGITNGMPVTVRTAIKPTPSIFKEQMTVSLKDGCDTSITLTGRHDPAIVHRARAVVDAVLAIAVADMLTVRFGTDFLA